jgi:putative hydrolase of the HAD superfamily
MQQITAIGFDLFDTLVTLQNLGYQEATDRLVHGLHAQDLVVQKEAFLSIYRDTARQFMTAARSDHKETHNRYWISAALHQSGHAVPPDDSRVTHAVEAYFSAFVDHAALLPKTLDMLAALKGRYRLGLLSNFTHPPAVYEMMSRFGLDAYLDVQLVSGDLGYRKPHGRVFEALSEQFGVPADQIAFVGDDLDADVHGARAAGLHPIRTTYAEAYKAALTTDVPPRPGDNPDPPVWRRIGQRAASTDHAEHDASNSQINTIASWDDLLTLLDIPPNTALAEGKSDAAPKVLETE